MHSDNKHDWNSILKISIAGAALIIAISTAHYFVIALPNQKEAELNFQREKYEDEKNKARADADTAKQKEQQEAFAKIEKENQLDECLKGARESYELNWAAACKIQLEKAQNGLALCSADAEYCSSLWSPVIEKSQDANCALMGNAGTDVDERYKAAKNECYLRYKN